MFFLLTAYIISVVVMFIIQVYNPHRQNDSFSLVVFTSVFYPIIAIFLGLYALLYMVSALVYTIIYELKRRMKK